MTTAADSAGDRLVARDHGGQLFAIDRGRSQLDRGPVCVRVRRRSGQRDCLQRGLRQFVQGARTGGPVRPTGRHVHGTGPGRRVGHGCGTRHGPLPAALRHVPVIVRHDIRPGARRGRVDGQSANRQRGPETVQDDPAGNRSRVGHLLPDRRRHPRNSQLGRQQAVPARKLQVNRIKTINPFYRVYFIEQ